MSDPERKPDDTVEMPAVADDDEDDYAEMHEP